MSTMSEEETGCKYLIPGLERGLQLLLLFSQQHRELSFTELHRLIDIPKATAYRVVQTLEHLGFLQRNPRNNTFALGINVLRLGFEYIAGLDVVQLGQPVIEQLRDNSGYSSHLAIRDGADVIYVARVSAAGATINQVSVGTRLPVHSTSLGRMLLSGVERAEFERLFPHDTLPPDGAVRERETLWQMVCEDRERGHVIGESFYRHGISSIVYPIFDRERRVAAVVSVMVPLDEIPEDERERLKQQVCQAAGTISGFLGAPHRLR